MSVAQELSLQSNMTSVSEAERLTVGASRIELLVGEKENREIVIVCTDPILLPRV